MRHSASMSWITYQFVFLCCFLVSFAFWEIKIESHTVVTCLNLCYCELAVFFVRWMKTIFAPLWLIYFSQGDSAALIGHDDVINRKHFPRYWPFLRGIHRSPVDFPHKGQWRWYLNCIWTNGWANNRDAGDLRHHRAHYDVSVLAFRKEESGKEDQISNWKFTLSFFGPRIWNFIALPC